MDPEDLREVITAYQKCVAEVVRHFGGYVAQYMGDGVLVYFGYPQAHEDDAERAVRAGLELVVAVANLKTHEALQARVGIATGLAVIGDLSGSGDTLEHGVVGETPNLAARLQSIADPNTVVIADGARKLIGKLFELKDLGARDLKGIAGPVKCWSVLRASAVEGRFEAFHASGLAELVGRQDPVKSSLSLTLIRGVCVHNAECAPRKAPRSDYLIRQSSSSGRCRCHRRFLARRTAALRVRGGSVHLLRTGTQADVGLFGRYQRG